MENGITIRPPIFRHRGIKSWEESKFAFEGPLLSIGMPLIVQISQDKQTNLFNTLPDDKILDLSKLKQIADDTLKCI